MNVSFFTFTIISSFTYILMVIVIFTLFKLNKKILEERTEG